MRYNANILPACVVVAHLFGSTLALPAPTDEECIAEAQSLYKRDADAFLDIPKVVATFGGNDEESSSPEHHGIQKRGLEKRTLYSLAQRLLGKMCSTKAAREEADLMNASIQSNSGVSQQNAIAPEGDDQNPMASSYEIITGGPGNNAPADLSQSFVAPGNPIQAPRIQDNARFQQLFQDVEPIPELPAQEDRESDVESVSLRESIKSNDNSFYPGQKAKDFFKDPSLWGSGSLDSSSSQADDSDILGVAPDDLMSISSTPRKNTMLPGGPRRHQDGPPSGMGKKPGFLKRLFSGGRDPRNQPQSGGMNYNVPQFVPQNPEIIDNPNWLVNPAERLYELERARRAEAQREADAFNQDERQRQQDLYDELFPEGDQVDLNVAQILPSTNPLTVAQMLPSNGLMGTAQVLPTNNLMGTAQVAPSNGLMGTAQVLSTAENGPLGPIRTLEESDFMQESLDPLETATIFNPLDRAQVMSVPAGRISSQNDIPYPNNPPAERASTVYQSFSEPNEQDPSFQDDIYSIADSNQTGDFGGNVNDSASLGASGNLGVSQIQPYGGGNLGTSQVQQKVTEIIEEDDAEYNSEGSRNPDEYEVDLLESEVIDQSQLPSNLQNLGANDLGFSFANPRPGGGNIQRR
ncbi:hypothetical protein H072_8351 [Dactylellina haptotyla CBS 200.50]|uniref:Uncharacterized protein n=1 Tax=Dactylellina haptotyla (strain CBS 200.50) TaxID=1284197 RepID=S8BF71_DACHA|nr:hypothetical protein H072_8351 [Dactylellina haptotyla CBS 200.50]